MNDNSYTPFGSTDTGSSGYGSSQYGSAYERSRYQLESGSSDHGETNWTTLAVGALLTGAGLYLIVRALGGPGASQGRGEERGKRIDVRESVTIDKPAEELYRYWRDLTNLPHIMRHLKSVETLGGSRSHWVAKGPLNTSVEWDAEITEDVPNERIAWRSLPDSQVPNEGSVQFGSAPGGRGTEVRVRLSYEPPLGALGAAVAKLFGEEPNQQVADDLRRFKQRMETGEIATAQGQTSGRTG